ncbi:hypothetical protein M0802_013448 [Mischocyttarus mexicanus]|nr:hypothetical protein M0802_013448 [Mischocyttarus mexicanus]
MIAISGVQSTEGIRVSNVISYNLTLVISFSKICNLMIVNYLRHATLQDTQLTKVSHLKYEIKAYHQSRLKMPRISQEMREVCSQKGRTSDEEENGGWNMVVQGVKSEEEFVVFGEMF